MSQLQAYKEQRERESDYWESERDGDGYVLSRVLPRYREFVEEVIEKSIASTYKECWYKACSESRLDLHNEEVAAACYDLLD